MGKSSGDASSADSPAPAAANPAPAAASPASPAAPSEHHNDAGSASTAPSSSPSKSAVSGEHYFLMKQVKIIDQGLGQGKPAYDLMIPKDWQFKGWVNQNVAEGGCFADWFAVVGDAKSADNSIELQILPQFTWQYVTDPQAQGQLQQENKQGAKVGLTPCPVRMPVHAADFLRQDLLEKYRKGKPIVSIEPFPELNQIARHRLGLPPDGTGNPGGIHTER